MDLVRKLAEIYVLARAIYLGLTAFFHAAFRNSPCASASDKVLNTSVLDVTGGRRSTVEEGHRAFSLSTKKAVELVQENRNFFGKELDLFGQNKTPAIGSQRIHETTSIAVGR